MNPDLCRRLADLDGGTSAVEAMRACLAAAAGSACRHAFISRFDAGAMAAAEAIDSLHAAGLPWPPLAGLAVSVKAVFDVAGHVTTAGSRLFDADPAAAADSLAVERLRRAGAALVGHTNMTEFAFSGVGINPHFGTPANPATAALDPVPRIPGGSTSGGAVSVATGAAWAALGSDTGGSIRIPAALQGLVGFKNTARLTPTAGAIPLSTTLDTACAITHSVRDAVLLHEILADRRVAPTGRPLAGYRLAVAGTLMQDGLDATVGRAFERSLRLLRAAGVSIEALPLPELAELSAMQAQGSFAAAEAWALHGARVGAREADVDPRVASRMRRGQTMSAADYLQLGRARQGWMLRLGDALRGVDAVLSPTVPIVAPPLQALLDDDDAFFAANALLLRNPTVVNMLDGCAISLPCHAPDELPVGLMLWAPALADDVLLSLALAVEAALAAARN